MVVKRGQTLGTQEQEMLAGSGIVTVRAGGAPPGLKAGSPVACATRHCGD